MPSSTLRSTASLASTAATEWSSSLQQRHTRVLQRVYRLQRRWQWQPAPLGGALAQLGRQPGAILRGDPAEQQILLGVGMTVRSVFTAYYGVAFESMYPWRGRRGIRRSLRLANPLACFFPLILKEKIVGKGVPS